MGHMPELGAPDHTIARLLLERGIAAIYAVGFLVAYNQFPALAGERGLEPAPRFLQVVRRFRDAPTIFRWIGYSDAKLRTISLAGIAISLALLAGIPQGGLVPAAVALPLTMLCWFGLWALYQSIVNIGGTFYGFGWETLLLEAGFLAIFLGTPAIAPPLLVLILFWWLAFRVEFGAGLIKLRGDPCWRDLTCMEFHHETQPMPNPLSWFFHRLPRPWHRFETIGNFVAQLALPFALFLPQPVATIAAVLMIATQLYLVVSGNYAWLNWITIIVMTAALADSVLAGLPLVGQLVPVGFGPPATFEPAPVWFSIAVVALTGLVAILSVPVVRNLMSPYQAMNASFDPFRLVNTYGAFGSVSRVRDEVVVEGTADDVVTPSTAWSEYEFKGKPTDVRRLPRQFAPYHLRLDWLMWFLPLSARYGERWFVPFLTKLLEGDRPTLQLLRRNPFPDQPPRFVRARRYRYRFTTWRERRETGAWWARTLVGEYMPPIRLRDQPPSRLT